MTTLTINPLDLILARNEFLKDCEEALFKKKDQIRLVFNYLDKDHTANFSVYIGDRLIDPNWTLEKRDLSSISLNQLTHASKRLTKNETTGLVARCIGVTLHNNDIDVIEKITGGWMINISPSSLRFTGNFKIKNH